MADRALRRRCERILADLQAPDWHGIRELCDLIGRRQGKPIRLLAEALPSSIHCGLVVRTRSFDAIFYEKDTSVFHQKQIIGHELGHILCGHLGAAVWDGDVSRLLMPNLDPALVRSVLGRSNFTTREEQEAEMIASLILRRSMAAPRHTPLAGGSELAPLMNRLEHTLEDPDRGRHRG